MPKDHLRVAAYGDVDELNALLGVVKASAGDPPGRPSWAGSSATCSPWARSSPIPPRRWPAARPRPPSASAHTRRLEKAIDAAEKGLPALTAFILPGGTPLGAHLHLARTVCRRAERAMVTLHRDTPLDPRLLEYVNRLSDLLFVLARAANHQAGHSEDRW